MTELTKPPLLRQISELRTPCQAKFLTHTCSRIVAHSPTHSLETRGFLSGIFNHSVHPVTFPTIGITPDIITMRVPVPTIGRVTVNSQPTDGSDIDEQGKENGTSGQQIMVSAYLLGSAFVLSILLL